MGLFAYNKKHREELAKQKETKVEPRVETKVVEQPKRVVEANSVENKTTARTAPKETVAKKK